MKKKIIISAIILAVLLIAGAVAYFYSNKDKEGQLLTIDPGFSEYITAIPSGLLSAGSPVKIILANPWAGYDPENPVADDELFEFSPSVEGTARWIDAKTVEFTPKEKFKSGEYYEVRFALIKVLQVPEKFEYLNFGIQIIKQNFMVTTESMNTDMSKPVMYIFEGILKSADDITTDELQKIVTAKYLDKNLTIEWIPTEDMREHKFRISGIERQKEESNLYITWDAQEIGLEIKGEQQIAITALGDFKVTSLSVIQSPEQYLKIMLSDPVDPNSDLTGMITTDSNTEFRLVTDGNSILAYPKVRLQGEIKITVSSGIKSILGYKLKEAYIQTITFSVNKPQVEILGTGTILPSSDGLVIPFRAVSLNAVDVTIIKIFENNVPQFLQVNDLDGMYELKRVGRPVFTQKIMLESDKMLDLGIWNTYSIDLSKMIEADPGSLYRVKISFKKSYSLYQCESDGEDEDVQSLSSEWDEESNDDSNWDDYESYYGEDGYYDEGYYDYDYSELDNPCSERYYRDSRFPSRTVFASNLGIIAKADNNNRITVAVSDIRTTEPISGVSVEVLNYQQQIVATGKTDGDGFLSVKSDQKPYIIKAISGNERGYLRMNSSSALSLSMFDIGGVDNKKGTKGFIYGERGVWRPGDTIHLCFILEDKDNLIPDNHPVTLEIYNPQYQKVNKFVKTSGVNGFYYFKVPTAQEDITGDWQARVKVGGSIWYKQLKIETIKPNRLRIKFDFKDEVLTNNEGTAGNMQITWMHGAVARNLRATVDVTLKPTTTQFKKFLEFNFDDPASSFNSEEQTIFDSYIDENGTALIRPNINIENQAPGFLTAFFSTKVYEKSGDFSIDNFSKTYSPYNYYVGVKMPKGDKARGMLLTDTTHKIEIATADESGNPVSRTNLTVKVYKLDWKWWWNSGDENLAYYVSSEYHHPLQTKTVSTKNGRGVFDLRINYPEWGRYLIRITDDAGHSTGKIFYMDWPGWAGRAQKDNGGAAKVLSFSTDKQAYKVAEKAIVSIPATTKGRALVSIEKGAKVLEQHWVEIEGKEKQFEFEVTPEMAPNAYINVTMIQPHKKENDLPIRMYGYTNITVEDPNTILKPVLKMPDVLESEQVVNLSVKEESGKAMTYTIAVVDEGLLSLTRFKTPDPWSSFYAREALSIRTWDVYDDIIGAYGGRIEKVFGIGGDEELNNDGNKSANRFKPVVMYLGPFTLEKGKENKHSFKLPQYIGSVKTMVIAGNNGAYGFTDKATAVRKPLMLLATLPRVLAPGEKLKLPVTIFAGDPSVKNVQVEVLANEFFIFKNSRTQTLSFSEPGDKIAEFDIEIAQKLGIGKVSVIAKSGSHKAQYDIEIDIKNPNSFVTEVQSQVLNVGESWSPDYTLFGVTGSNSASVEFSSMPPIDLSRRLQYLIQYPYGCIEQTTSSVFPQLFLDNLIQMSKEDKNKIEINIKSGINRLQKFIRSDGSMSYWPGDSYVSDWGTNYAGHFLLEAEKKGYALPAGFKANWISFQTQAAKNWVSSSSNGSYSDHIQAYRLYTLALANAPEIGAMNRLKESGSLTLQARWRLAAAYKLAGKEDVAKSLIQNASIEIAPYREQSYSYGSDSRDRAMILETLILMKDLNKAMPLIEQVSKDLSANTWMSTQTTAYCLIAISRLSDNKTFGGISCSFSQNGGAAKKIVSGNLLAKSDLKITDAKTGKISVKNEGTGMLYARLILNGQPQMGNEVESAENISLYVTYKDSDGNTIDPASVRQGEDVMISVTVSNKGVYGDYRNLALSVPVPSGWEIENTRLNGYTAAYTKDIPEYMDIRDSRVDMFFSLGYAETKTFNIMCNASYFGDYYLPGAYIEAMYDNRIHAKSAGKWVQIVK